MCITMHVDSPATIIQIAENRGVYSIGFQSIEARAARAEGLDHRAGLQLGAVHDGDREEVMAGTFKRPMVREGLGEKMMVIAPFGDSVPEEARAAVDAAAEKVARRLQALHRADQGQHRRVRLKAGESWGGDKMGKFDWYVEGVIGSGDRRRPWR